MTKYITHNQVRMHDTDMAGLLYFARIFRFAHDALEDFAAENDMSFNKLFHEEEFVFVIVHCEADYHVHVAVGDGIEVHASVAHIGQTSFSIFYEFFKDDGVLMGTAKTVHVTLNSKTRKKIRIPDKLRKTLEPYLAEVKAAK